MVELSKQYLPHLSCGLSDPRVHLHILDGKNLGALFKQKFDVIITDASDDIGESIREMKGEREGKREVA